MAGKRFFARAQRALCCLIVGALGTAAVLAQPAETPAPQPPAPQPAPPEQQPQPPSAPPEQSAAPAQPTAPAQAPGPQPGAVKSPGASLRMIDRIVAVVNDEV